MTEKEQPILDRFRSQLGQDVTVDYFLYVCFEAEKIQIQNETRTQPWQPLTDAEWTSKLDTSALPSAVRELVKHYTTCFPTLSDGQPVDFARLDEVVQPFVEFTIELRNLVKAATEEALVFDPNSEPWASLINSVEQSMPGGQKLMKRYLEWTYSSYTEEVDEPGSRPPVGKHAPYFPRKPLSRGPARSNSDNRDRGQNRSNQGNRKPREKSSKDLAGPVIKEAEAACRKLREQADLESIKLAPQNSYYRRMQHNCVGKEGFHSSSYGEGAKRCIVVTREPSGKKG